MSLKKAVGLLAAFALAVGLIGAGVGAQFTDFVTARENINVGTFQCQIVAATPVGASTVIAVDGKSVTYTAPTIMSSAPGSAPFSFTVQNTGTIADVLTVSTSPVLSAPWSIIGAPFAAVPLTAGDSTTYNTGVEWTELSNANLGQQGTVTWTVNCGEATPVGVAYYTISDGNGFCRSVAPQATVGLNPAGTASEVVNGNGSVTLSITGATSYADVGFYVPLGKLGDLTGYNIASSGDQLGTNLYFDTSGDGSFFAWGTNGCMTGLNGDLYGLGPDGNNVTVDGSSTFLYVGSCSDTLAQYKAGDCAGITSSTQVAAWVGITLGTGGTGSVTITAAP